MVWRYRCNPFVRVIPEFKQPVVFDWVKNSRLKHQRDMIDAMAYSTYLIQQSIQYGKSSYYEALLNKQTTTRK